VLRRRLTALAVCVICLAAISFAPGSASARDQGHGCDVLTGGSDHARHISWRTARSMKLVLGGKEFAAPNGEGWGTERPSRIFNGGDLSGLITQVRWTSWGGTLAIGWGKESIFKPRGGYYPRPVSIKLRAEAIGDCEGRQAYMRLSFRYPSHPGGRLGPWRLWSGDTSICSSSS
jgi:hypothetical protein